MNLCAAKETISKMKRSLTNWEKIFENDVINNFQNIQTDNIIQLKKKQQHKYPIEKWAKDLNGHFLKEHVHRAD